MPGIGPLPSPGRIRTKPLGQANVPLDVLEYPDEGYGTATATHDENGRKMESLGGAMDPQLEELNRKIDALTSQVAYLTEQAREAELARRSGDDLLETAMPIARSAMDLAIPHLEDVQ